MTVTQAFRYELEPTVRQQRLLARAAGTARYAFNWGLALCKRLLDAGKPVPHAAELHRQWNAEKPQRSWVYGVSNTGVTLNVSATLTGSETRAAAGAPLFG